jgi:hypothetical protein
VVSGWHTRRDGERDFGNCSCHPWPRCLLFTVQAHGRSSVAPCRRGCGWRWTYSGKAGTRTQTDSRVCHKQEGLMARYRIIYTRQEPAAAPPSHQHIVAVGTGTEPCHYTHLWSLDQVLEAMRRGDSFYTQVSRAAGLRRSNRTTAPTAGGPTSVQTAMSLRTIIWTTSLVAADRKEAGSLSIVHIIFHRCDLGFYWAPSIHGPGPSDASQRLAASRCQALLLVFHSRRGE